MSDRREWNKKRIHVLKFGQGAQKIFVRVTRFHECFIVGVELDCDFCTGAGEHLCWRRLEEEKVSATFDKKRKTFLIRRSFKSFSAKVRHEPDMSLTTDSRIRIRSLKS